MAMVEELSPRPLILSNRSGPIGLKIYTRFFYCFYRLFHPHTYNQSAWLFVTKIYDTITPSASSCSLIQPLDPPPERIESSENNLPTPSTARQQAGDLAIVWAIQLPMPQRIQLAYNAYVQANKAAKTYRVEYLTLRGRINGVKSSA